MKRRKLLLKWVCSTIILCLVVFGDYTLGFLPTYYFWRGILFPLMIFDGTLATKIMMSFENHIESVEKWVDKVVHAVCSVYNVAYFPTFVFLVQKLDFVVNGSSPAQLDIIEKLFKTFKANIKKAERTLSPVKPEAKKAIVTPPEKKIEKFENRVKVERSISEIVKPIKISPSSPRETPAKLTTPRSSKTISQPQINADVKLLKTSNLGKKIFVACNISYDSRTNKLTLKVPGESSICDTLTGARIRDNSKHVLEIQLDSGSKIISFPTTELLETWAKQLQSQC